MLFLFQRCISGDVPEVHHSFLGFWQCKAAEHQELKSGERGTIASISLYHLLPPRISQDLSYPLLSCLASWRSLVYLVISSLGFCSKASPWLQSSWLPVPESFPVLLYLSVDGGEEPNKSRHAHKFQDSRAACFRWAVGVYIWEYWYGIWMVWPCCSKLEQWWRGKVFCGFPDVFKHTQMAPT